MFQSICSFVVLGVVHKTVSHSKLVLKFAAPFPLCTALWGTVTKQHTHKLSMFFNIYVYTGKSAFKHIK